MTASRTVRRRVTDYTRLAAVYPPRRRHHHAARRPWRTYRRLADIRRNRHPYGSWLLTCAPGCCAGAASLLVGGSPDHLPRPRGSPRCSATGWRGCWPGAGSRSSTSSRRPRVPAAAMGVLVDRAHWIPGAAGVQSSAVITGGLFALLPGRALVAAVQDGLTGFYITASARLLEVDLPRRRHRHRRHADPLRGCPRSAPTSTRTRRSAAYDHPWCRLVAAMVLTLAFAVLLQCERGGARASPLNGGVAWTRLRRPAPAGGRQPGRPRPPRQRAWSGLFGQLMARYRYVSVLPYVTAAIGPLLPGSRDVLRACWRFTQHHSDTAAARSRLKCSACAGAGHRGQPRQ